MGRRYNAVKTPQIGGAALTSRSRQDSVLSMECVGKSIGLIAQSSTSIDLYWRCVVRP